MTEVGEAGTRMLPLWVQWSLAIGGLSLIVAVFAAVRRRLGMIEERLGRLESRLDDIAPQREAPAPSVKSAGNPPAMPGSRLRRLTGVAWWGTRSVYRRIPSATR